MIFFYLEKNPCLLAFGHLQKSFYFKLDNERYLTCSELDVMALTFIQGHIVWECNVFSGHFVAYFSSSVKEISLLL